MKCLSKESEILKYFEVIHRLVSSESIINLYQLFFFTTTV